MWTETLWCSSVHNPSWQLPCFFQGRKHTEVWGVVRDGVMEFPVWVFSMFCSILLCSIQYMFISFSFFLMLSFQACSFDLLPLGGVRVLSINDDTLLDLKMSARNMIYVYGLLVQTRSSLAFNIHQWWLPSLYCLRRLEPSIPNLKGHWCSITWKHMSSIYVYCRRHIYCGAGH